MRKSVAFGFVLALVASPAGAVDINECGLGLVPEGWTCEAPTVMDGNGGIVEIERVPADTEVADKMKRIKKKLAKRFGWRKAKRIMARYGDKIQAHLEDHYGEDTPAMTIKTRNGDPSHDSGQGDGRGGDRDPSHSGAGRN